MYRIYGAIIEIVAASVFLVPLLGLYGKYNVRNTRRTLAYIVLGFYFIAVLALVGFPNVISLNIDFTFNIIPFIDMAADFKNACLNVILFVPLGIFLPLLWDKYRDIKSTMFVALYITVLIEFSQFFTFRTTDINDIITNILGTILGYFMVQRITKNFARYVNSNTNYQELYVICVIVIFVTFFLQPFVSSFLWEMVL